MALPKMRYGLPLPGIMGWERCRGLHADRTAGLLSRPRARLYRCGDPAASWRLSGAKPHGRAVEGAAGDRGGQGSRQGAGVVELLHAAARRPRPWRRQLPLRGRAAFQSGVCSVRRGDGADRLGVGMLQLLRARYRQHGGVRALRHGRAEGTLAAAADERRDPLRLPDDRAAGRLVRCDQHPDRDGPRWRPLCRQRPQMVVVGGRRSALQGRDPDGQDRFRRGTAPAAVDDDPRHGHAGCEDRADAVRLWL